MRLFAERTYPGDPQAYEKYVFPRICCLEPNEEVRVRVDEAVRKMLNRETLSLWKEYEREF